MKRNAKHIMKDMQTIYLRHGITTVQDGATNMQGFNIQIALKEGKQILAHCNGDAASEQYLNAYEQAAAVEKLSVKNSKFLCMTHP